MAILEHNNGTEWAVASLPFPGQAVSGDLHLVAPFEDGVLAAVVDGVGHGSEAATAATKAIGVLARHAGESVIGLVRLCHEALRDTRGVVMTVVSYNRRDATITALGVGNVEAVLLRANPAAQTPRESVLLRNGVIGYQLPALYASVMPVFPGDLLVFATDGVKETGFERLSAGEPLPVLADRLLQKHLRGNDDALVLAIRYLARSHG